LKKREGRRGEIIEKIIILITKTKVIISNNNK